MSEGRYWISRRLERRTVLESGEAGVNEMKIDHIGIAVNDLETALKTFTALGLKVHARGTLESQQVEIISLGIGESTIELLKPTGAGAIQKFLSTKGEGIHHIALAVDNLEAALADARAKGIRLIDEKPRIGFGDKKIAFIHPGGTHGVLVELVQG